MGLQYLSETPMINTLESEILTYGSFEYEKDWDLGDIVTVQNNAWGIAMDARITEVTEIYEPEVLSCRPCSAQDTFTCRQG